MRTIEISATGYLGRHFSVRFVGEYDVIGSFERLPDGRYLATFNRKPVDTLEDVVRQVIGKAVRGHQRSIARLQDVDVAAEVNLLATLEGKL